MCSNDQLSGITDCCLLGPINVKATCKKCNGKSDVVIQGPQYLCKTCFSEFFSAKIRKTLNKYKPMEFDEKIAIAYSGGQSSGCLLQIMHKLLNLKEKSSFKFEPMVVYINELCDDEKCDNIENFCKRLNIKYHCIHINKLIDEEERFTILSEYCKSENIKKIMLGVNGGHVCFKAFESLAKGLGELAIESVKFAQTYKNIIFFKPLIEFTPKEIGLYAHYNNIESFVFATQNLTAHNSLHTVISSFIFKLQESHNLTISTVCKTLEKVKVMEDC